LRDRGNSGDFKGRAVAKQKKHTVNRNLYLEYFGKNSEVRESRAVLKIEDSQNSFFLEMNVPKLTKIRY